MAWGKGAYYGMAIGYVIEFVMICKFFIVGLFYHGIGFLAFLGLILWFQYATIKNNRYEINGDNLIVRCFADEARIYPIDKIQKIVFVDLGTDWQSIEPRRFGLEDRESFVNTLIEINPNIIVEKEETKIKEE